MQNAHIKCQKNDVKPHYAELTRHLYGNRKYTERMTEILLNFNPSSRMLISILT